VRRGLLDDGPAGPAATAWAVPGIGHAQSGATDPLVERIGRWASATIGA
jgi:uncharacterized protein